MPLTEALTESAMTDLLLLLILLALPGGTAIAAIAGKTLFGFVLVFVVVILPILLLWGWLSGAYRKFKTRKIRRDPRYRLGGYQYDDTSKRWLRWDGERYRPDTDKPPMGFWPDPNTWP